jgi:Ca2+/Na+ antiporter
MITSLGFYVLVVEMLKNIPGGTQKPDLFVDISILRYLLGGLSIGSVFGIKFFRKLFLHNRARLQLNRFPYKAFSPDLQRLMFVSVTTFAFCESVAIFGLVLFLVGRTSTDFYVLLVFSLILFATFFPKYSEWESWLKRWAQRKGG